MTVPSTFHQIESEDANAKKTTARVNLRLQRLRDRGLPVVADVVVACPRKTFLSHVTSFGKGFTCSLDFLLASNDNFQPTLKVAREEANEKFDSLAIRRHWLEVGKHIQDGMNRVAWEASLGDDNT
jgi:hypothetical protein